MLQRQLFAKQKFDAVQKSNNKYKCCVNAIYEVNNTKRISEHPSENSCSKYENGEREKKVPNPKTRQESKYGTTN